MLGWRHSGFSAHNEVRAPAEDAEGRKKLAGWMLGVPMSLAKIRALRFQSHFAPNADSMTISGGVVRGARDLYHLDARSGHRLNVTIKAPAESAVFQLYRPGYTLTSDGAITAIKGEALIGAGETDDARAWTGPLSSRQCWYGAVCCLLLRLRNGPRPRARSPPSRPGGSPSSMPPPRPAGTGAAFRHTQIRSPGAST